MNLKLKIITNVSVVLVIALSTLSIVLGTLANKTVSSAMHDQVELRLIALRDAKKEQIESYFDFIADQVTTYANNKMIITAANQFNASYPNIAGSVGSVHSTAQQSEVLSDFYQQHFTPKFNRLNATNEFTTAQLVAALSPQALAAQYLYIGANPNALGEKDALDSFDDDSQYSEVHHQYHPVIRQYLHAFGYYDIFLVNPDSGDVVYSVFKELDYGTSLIDGHYRDSGLAKAFQQAKSLPKGETAIIDFAPYYPSFNAPASFIASPVYDQDRLVSVLIFQMPVDRINGIMTYGGKWQQSGLGQSGETYLVGNDKTMRSMSRFLMEDPANYIKALRANGSDENDIKNIEFKQTSIGYQQVNSIAAQQALKGNRGFDIIEDYRGVSVVSAYTPLLIKGLNWSLLSEIDEQEALAVEQQLVSDITTTAIVLTVIFSAIGIGIAVYLGNTIAKPINVLSRFVDGAADNLDLTQRLTIRTKRADDEIDRLAHSFNRMMDAFNRTIEKVLGSSNLLSENVHQLTANFTHVMQKSQEQMMLSYQVSAAIEEMAATAEDVAKNAEGTKDISAIAVNESESGKANVDSNMSETRSLSGAMEKAMNNMTQLLEQSNEVGSVLEVISGIAQQTNLLALNAAIEAARAGEQGRGFAVVADEVRTLAQRTGQATEQIQKIIANLQQGADEASTATKTALTMAQTTLVSADKVRGSLSEINIKVHDIEDCNTQVATAATQQSVTARSMTEQVGAINALTQDNHELTEQANQAIKHVEEEAQLLRNEVNLFNIKST
jgi:methyl-accepting chemotaxis protein